jgi:hypothetical protein
MYSWYTHRLWPYRRFQEIREKHLELPRNITLLNENITTPIEKYIDNATYRLQHSNLTREVTWVEKKFEEEADDGTLWAPIIILSVVLFLYNIGLGSVPYVLVSEMFSIHVS